MFESIPLQFQIVMAVAASIISIYLVFRGFKTKAPYLLILAIFIIFLVCVLEILRKAIAYHFLYFLISVKMIGNIQLVLFILMLALFFIDAFMYGEKKEKRKFKILLVYLTIIFLISIYILFFYK